MRQPVRLAVLLFALVIVLGQSKPKTDAEIKRAIISESIANYRGSCACPYNTAGPAENVGLAARTVGQEARRHSATRRM